TARGPDTLRGVGEPWPTMGLTFALHPRRLLELAVPHFVPDEARFRVVDEVLGGGTALWSSSIFAGAVVLVLAAMAVVLRPRAVWPWAAVAALCAWLALGDRGGLLRVACVGAAVLAGAAACVFFFDVPGLVWRSAGRTLGAGDVAWAAVHAAWLRGAATSAAFAALLWLALAGGGQRRALGLLVPVLLFVELWLGNGDQFPLVAPEALTFPSPFAQAVLAET